MRLLRTVTVSLAALGLATLGAGGASAAAGQPTAMPAAASAACTGTASVQITQMTYSPPTIAPGQGTTLNVTAVNCTAAALTANVSFYATYLPNAVTAGCPILDPVMQQLSVAANATFTYSLGFGVQSACTATGVDGEIEINDADGGALLAQAFADLVISAAPPANACHVGYTLESEWQGGFSAALAITDTGTASVNGWTLTYRNGGDQKVTTVWGARASQSGVVVTLTADSYDRTIAPGATITDVGFNGTWTTSDAAPTGFTLNGTACN